MKIRIEFIEGALKNLRGMGAEIVDVYIHQGTMHRNAIIDFEGISGDKNFRQTLKIEMEEED